MPDQSKDRTRYESLRKHPGITRAKHPGITRVHARTCTWLNGERCSCEPGYRAQAFDNATQRRAYKTFPVLEQARRWRPDLQNTIRAGRHRVTDSPTIAAAWLEFYAGISDGTITASGGAAYKPGVVRLYESKFRNQVLPRFGRRKVSELRLVHVQAMVDEFGAQGRAAWTIRNTVVPLRAFYRWAIRKEYATVNPCDGYAATGRAEAARDRVATTAEALELLAALPDAHDRAVWATAFFAGLRRGELMALDWQQVDLAGRVLGVTRSYDPGSHRFVAPKSRKGTREVGIPKLLVPHLAQWQLASGRREGLVFGPNGATPFNGGRLHRSRGLGLDPGRRGHALAARPTRRARADRPARGPAHLRQPHDRGGREPQAHLRVDGTRQHHHHARPLRAPAARRPRDRARAARRLPRRGGRRLSPRCPTVSPGARRVRAPRVLRAPLDSKWIAAPLTANDPLWASSGAKPKL
jgi:integrase